jgi:hypothetical protein
MVINMKNWKPFFIVLLFGSFPAWTQDEEPDFPTTYDETNQLIVEIACNGLTGQSTPAGNFIIQGYLYPYGTIQNRVDGILANGAPEYPDKVIGRWMCRGWRFPERPPRAFINTVQTFEIHTDNPGEDMLITAGLEINAGALPVYSHNNTRAVIGGTGRFTKAIGEQQQFVPGVNPTMQPNFIEIFPKFKDHSIAGKAADKAGPYKPLAFDVAWDGFTFKQSPAGDFNLEGYIYPAGTLTGTNGIAPGGGPEFPDQVLGWWNNRGFFIIQLPQYPNMVAIANSTQTYDFNNDVPTQDMIISFGLEFGDTRTNHRALSGGTGKYGNVRGDHLQTVLGVNVSGGFNTTNVFPRMNGNR